MSKYTWELIKSDKKAAKNIADELMLPNIISRTLVNRGIMTIEEAKSYIKPGIWGMHSPFYFRDMEKAIERILKAVENKEAILIFGDKDVDGVTSTAIIYKLLHKLHGNIVYRVPEKMENYGISKDIVSWAVMNEFSLMITVDCGITAIEEVEYAKQMGMDVIITDHHEARDVVPDAYAIINPMVESDTYPFKKLCGAGVALKLAQGIIEKIDLPEYYNEEIVFFDLETSGLDPTRNEIIEIGAIIAKNGIKIDEFDVLIKPAQPISDEIKNITGLDNEILDREGIDTETALKQFIKFIGNRKIVGHNIVGFDMKFININTKKYLNMVIDNPMEDTLRMARVMIKKTKNYKLVTVASVLGLHVDEKTLHRSIPDSELNAEVYRRLILSKSARIDDLYREYLPLAAIGTVADIMPLHEENRNIVKNGIRYIPYSSVGLLSLLREINIDANNIVSKTIGWNIAPLLNSPGRVGDASLSVELLVSNKIHEAQELARDILEKDKERKSKVTESMEIAEKEILDTLKENQKIAILASDKYHKGMNGLMAHRLSNEFQIPVVIISLEDEESAGSVRVSGDFNVVTFLESLEDLFIQFGGHKYAGGFTIQSSRIEELKERAKKYMRDYKVSELKETVYLDKEINDFSDLSLSNMRYMENLLEPTGNANEIPKYLIKNVGIKNFRPIGKKGEHVLFYIIKGGQSLSIVGWNMAVQLDKMLKEHTSFDIVGYPEINRYQGSEEVRIILYDIEGK